MRKLLFLLSALPLVAGCTYAQGPDPGPCNASAAISYAGVIAPIVAANCSECHGGAVYRTLGGGHDLSTHQTLTSQSAAYLMSTVRHEPGAAAMPKGRPKLEECDIARLQAWVDAGQPNN